MVFLRRNKVIEDILCIYRTWPNVCLRLCWHYHKWINSSRLRWMCYKQVTNFSIICTISAKNFWHSLGHFGQFGQFCCAIFALSAGGICKYNKYWILNIDHLIFITCKIHNSSGKEVFCIFEKINNFPVFCFFLFDLLIFLKYYLIIWLISCYLFEVSAY